MPQLISPTTALNQAFILPKVETSEQRPNRVQSQSQNALVTYGFKVGNIGLLIPVGTASRLVETNITLCSLPNSLAWLLGMINLDGVAVPLFDLLVLLDLPRESAPTHYLVIDEGEDAVGITLTERPQRIRLEPEQRLKRNTPLPAALQAHARACYRDADQLWVEWDFQSFFSAAGQR